MYSERFYTMPGFTTRARGGALYDFSKEPHITARLTRRCFYGALLKREYKGKKTRAPVLDVIYGRRWNISRERIPRAGLYYTQRVIRAFFFNINLKMYISARSANSVQNFRECYYMQRRGEKPSVMICRGVLHARGRFRICFTAPQSVLLESE